MSENGKALNFQRCHECAILEPHGYFFEGEDQLSIVILSMRAAQYLLDMMTIEEEERAALEEAVKAAGIPEEQENAIDSVNYCIRRMLENDLVVFDVG